MARLSMVTAAKVNQPPTQLGTKIISTPNRTNYVFLQTDFTDTTPPYVDPDGDLPATVRILSLPVTGGLELNTVAVIVNQDITWADIGAGNLVYLPANQDAVYTESFTFDIADAGTLTLAGLAGTITITAENYANLPPSEVGDNTLNVAYDSVTVFTRANFTTETTPVYADPEGDAASKLKVTSVGTSGTLLLNGIQVVNNQIIDFSDIDAGNLTFLADGPIAGYTSNIDFEISDVGSEQFTA